MNGDQVADGDALYRRFDPADVHHWASDDSGIGGRIRSGALVWDGMPTDESPTAKGCSVYQSSKLAANDLPASACLERAGWALAAVDPVRVRAVTRVHVPELPSPFDSVEDEFPEGKDGAHARDAAHALIAHDHPLKGADRWYSELAKRFARVEV